MDIPPLVHHLMALAFLILLLGSFTSPFSDFESSDEPSSICSFERLSEVRRECNSFLSSASKLKLEGGKAYRMPNELSFRYGDWMQETGTSPLMPFDDGDMGKNFSDSGSLLKLVSFSIMDIDISHQYEDAVSVCGYLSIGISRNRSLSNDADGLSPWFRKEPGISELIIPFEGLYTETEGERLMCFLGTSVSPFSEGFPDPSELPMAYSSENYLQSPLLQDDRLMLVLRYPQTFSLTSRVIHGEMRNLNQNSNPKYFDKVYISSQLGYYSNYQFVSEKFVLKACNPYPCQDGLLDGGIIKGLEFCKIFQRLSAEKFDIVANSGCDGTEEHCHNLGPFVLGSEVKTTNGIQDKFRIMMNDLHCIPGDKLSTAKASAVFRVVSSGENLYIAEGRTGLSGMTITAEGTWNSSSGRLCMVGCVGLAETGSHGCNSRICLYFPFSFSITERSIVVGTMSSINNTDSHNLLSFRKVLRPLDAWNKYYDYSNSYLSYKYSKIESANIILKRNENFNLGTFMKKSFLKYPSVEDINNITSLSLLSDELSFDTYGLPDPLPNIHPPKAYVTMEVLSIGSLFGRHWAHFRDFSHKEEPQILTNSDSTKQDQLLNISAHFTLSGESHAHISVLYLEGLYNPLLGKAFLIGCRDIPLSQGSINITSLESRMDCLIEVKVEYSSKTTRWLINPTAKVSITSQRNVEDTLYFSPISIQTFLIPYSDNSKEFIFRLNLEESLRMLVLSASIACIYSQLFFIEKKVDAIPFISLAMLGIQALGYVLPLITDGAILFKWKEFQYSHNLLDVGKPTWFQVVDCTLKFLSLIAFVLTLRLCQKVKKARLKLLTSQPINWKHNPSDKLVFLSAWTIHMVGFVAVHIIHYKKTADGVISTHHKLSEWVIDVDEYMGLVQDFFLLPQIIGNVLWQTQVKSLRELYYIGFTLLRLLVRAYDCIRDPVFNHYFHKGDHNRSSVFFSKSEEVIIMAILVVLAITVHVQQGWNFNKSSQIEKFKQHSPPPLDSNS
ncbi:hypothetical protein CK203_047764 [Vitis vinifera]|uniref:RING-type E3 ubiquitin transferase n=1 Tax=Vitis vinifera TaxID=29760 RepID=A0A438GY66_VITVI|nr:hypothetical protein CK203_047764 [Vitis vinifera]